MVGLMDGLMDEWVDGVGYGLLCRVFGSWCLDRGVWIVVFGLM